MSVAVHDCATWLQPHPTVHPTLLVAPRRLAFKGPSTA